jgi:hypothetical protein
MLACATRSPTSCATRRMPACDGPSAYRDTDAVRADIIALRAATDGV